MRFARVRTHPVCRAVLFGLLFLAGPVATWAEKPGWPLELEWMPVDTATGSTASVLRLRGRQAFQRVDIELLAGDVEHQVRLSIAAGEQIFEAFPIASPSDAAVLPRLRVSASNPPGPAYQWVLTMPDRESRRQRPAAVGFNGKGSSRGRAVLEYRVKAR